MKETKQNNIDLRHYNYDLIISTRFIKVGNRLIQARLITKEYIIPGKKKIDWMQISLPRTYYKKTYTYNNIFMKKVFSMFIKKGKKVKIINFYVFFLHYLKNILKEKSTFNLFIYISQIVGKILPIFNSATFTKRGDKFSLPYIYYKKKKNVKKLMSISANWIKKAVLLRKEKTLFLKILSELQSIRLGVNCESLKMKQDYYKNFYKNKYFLKFLRGRKWI